MCSLIKKLKEQPQGMPTVGKAMLAMKQLKEGDSRPSITQPKSKLTVKRKGTKRTANTGSSIKSGSVGLKI